MFNNSANNLPFFDSVARCYEAFDLPYGAPLDEVTARYQAYLDKCHPEHHTGSEELLSDAYRLTGILTYAHGEILEAWQKYGPRKDTLPFDPELAEYFQALDLPYGTPMEEVTRRWREYLKICHPDRHARDPEKLPDANTLTRVLTQAHERIKEAWARQQDIAGRS